MNPRRMEAEVVRDSTLPVAGSLDATMFGPDLDRELGPDRAAAEPLLPQRARKRR